MPKSPESNPTPRFTSRFNHVACWICLGVFILFALGGMLAFFKDYEQWERLLYVSALALFAAAKFARGIDPYDRLPQLRKLPP
jgi:hypothetical protein